MPLILPKVRVLDASNAEIQRGWAEELPELEVRGQYHAYSYEGHTDQTQPNVLAPMTDVSQAPDLEEFS